jgi:hypothetical protein
MNLKFLNFFNSRTVIAILISQLAAFISIKYQIKWDINVMLFGLAIVFPLHFSIQAAYQRRERALQYFSKFKGAVISLYYSIQLPDDLTAEKKSEGRNLLRELVQGLITKLNNREPGYETVQQDLNEVFSFISTHKKDLSKGNAIKMIRYIYRASEASVYLVNIISHRTMAGLRFYAIFFVLIFPCIQAPILLHRLDGLLPDWSLYIVVALTSVILISLTNFQKMIEYPFDQSGPDNVQLKEFDLGV